MAAETGWARNQRSPFWATALSRMTPAGQRLARGVDGVIHRSPVLASWAWVGSGWRLVSTVATTSVPEHQTGRALDVIFGEVGRRPTAEQRSYANALVDALIRNHKTIGIQWIIWSRDGKDRPMSWSSSRGTWKALAGRGSISGNHIDHAHIYLTASGPGWASALDDLTIGKPGLPSAGDGPTTPSPEEDDIMAMTPAERAQLVAEIADASRAAVVGQLMTGPGINPDTKPTLHDYLVQLPQRTSSAVHGQWLGSSGPAIGTALQGTYHGVQALAVRVEALIALLEQAGPSTDVATMQRIADEAVTDYAQRLAAAVETA